MVLRKLLYAAIFLSIFCFNRGSVLAMSSGSNAINSDILNESGGYSDSSNYRIWHNLGENSTGTSQSANYRIYSGFITPDNYTLIFSVSPGSINLGTLTDLSVSTQSAAITVSTSSILGYSVKAYDNTPVGIEYGLIDGSKKIADATTPNVFINLPVAGVEHYGLTITGTHADAGYVSGTKINSLDNSTLSNIGSYNSFIANDILTAQYRASVSLLSAAGNNYTATTTYICTTNY
ncbi:MAG: hypothetical protein M1338_01480 [Patescibacteria group bacterium]|nr:hypothetical protein [Patescibacteria group bacterium]